MLFFLQLNEPIVLTDTCTRGSYLNESLGLFFFFAPPKKKRFEIVKYIGTFKNEDCVVNSISVIGKGIYSTKIG